MIAALLAAGALQAPARLPSLDKVNLQVNASIRYGIDGVCSDYAFRKLAILLAQGYPRDRLHLATAKVRGQRHMVLIIEDAGHSPVVLDNRYDHPEPLALLTSREGYQDVDIWPAPTPAP